MTKIKMQMLLVGALSCGFGVKQVRCRVFGFGWFEETTAIGVEGDILK